MRQRMLASPKQKEQPKRFFEFNRIYFAVAVFIFFVEVLIALYVNDRFVRPYVGDVLVVILIYCFVRSFVNARPLPMAIAVLAFSFTVEFFQYIHIVDLLGLSDSAIARTVIGTSYAWQDLIAYTAGATVIVLVEIFVTKRAT